MFITSNICPALLEELSTLKTSMDQEIVWVLISLKWTKSQSIKLLVAPQSRSVLTEWSLLVLVVLISTSRTKNVLYVSRALAKSCLGNCFFHFGFQEVVLTIGAEKEGNVFAGSLSFVLISSILSTVNLFIGSTWGTSFTSHSTQNPLQRGTLFLPL